MGVGSGLAEKDVKELFDRRVIMAPMAGVNTRAFCRMLIDNGCDFIYSGLLTSHGLVYSSNKTEDMIDSLPEAENLDVAAQIFGATPDIMAEAARIIEDTGKADIIDINMGCPVPKVVKTRAGVRLMQNPELAASVVAAVVKAVRLPVTVKMRSGWDSRSINCVEVARMCADAGAAAVALHPRTRVQRFGGCADWTLIAKLKAAVDVPVIASGDVADPESAARCFRETGCDSLMIGRASMGDPGLPARARRLVRDGVPAPPPDFRKRLSDARRHLELHVADVGEEKGVREMRGPLAWYIKGLYGAAAVRVKINTTTGLEKVNSLLAAFEKRLADRYESDSEDDTN